MNKKISTSRDDMEDSQNHKDSTEEVSAQKGGLRTIPFIIANESFHNVASLGILPNMILYMINGYNMNTATASTILSIWSSSTDFLSIFGAFISDGYLGRFRVIVLGSIFSSLGMALLWLTAMIPTAKPPPCNSSQSGCQNPTFVQLAFVLLSLGFISVGGGCIKPCSMAYGADQLVTEHKLEKTERLVQSYFNWYYAAVSISGVIALTVVVYIQDEFGWKVGFGVPAILMLLSTAFFLGGSSIYVKMNGDKSLFTGLAQVVVAAIKNRHLLLPSDTLYWHKKDSNLSVPSNRQRFLNKACIIKNPEEDFNENGLATKPWELCSVEQVESLKALISVIPIWSTGIISYVAVNQSSLAVIQATSMDRHIISNFQIPAGSFSLFTALSAAIWVVFYDRLVVPLVARFTGRPGGMSTKLRMGIGLIFSCLTMVLAAIVESIRRKIAIEEGLSEDPATVVSMSAMWLIPQFTCLGFAMVLNGVGQIEYYYSELPKSMSSMAMALYTLMSAFAGLLSSLVTVIVNKVTQSGGNISWLSTNINKGHYDYQYGLISFLCFLNIMYYLFICRGTCGTQKDVRGRISNERDDLKEALLY